MRIAIIGGHGKVALRLAPLLREAGHEVDAIIRNPEHADDVRRAGAEPVVHDVEHSDLDELTAVLDGHDVVVWSAGAGGGNPARTYAVDRDAAIRSMDAATRAGVGRYVMVSYQGAGPDHGIPQDDPFHAYAEAKAAADAHLRALEDGPAWTIVAPGALSLDEPTGLIDASGHGTADVPRADVAAVIAAVVDRADLAGRTIAFVGGRTPIAEALDAAARG